jgi:hypothetical protein
MYRIAWVNWRGYKGHGKFCMTLDDANDMLKSLQDLEVIFASYPKFSPIHHWIEDDQTPHAQAARIGMRILSSKHSTLIDELAFVHLESMLE